MSLPYIYGGGIGPEVVASGALLLPANGGSVIVPFLVDNDAIVQSGTLRTTDVTLAHTLEVGLYQEDGAILNLLGIPGSFTFTAAAAANRTGSLGQPVAVRAGTLYLAIRNAGANPTSLATAPAGTLGGNLAMTATLAGLAAILTGTAWAAIASLPIVRLNMGVPALGGRVL